MNIRTGILFVVLLLPASGALAMARAPFPDPTKLQPIPTYVRPNISGNVRSSQTPATYPAPGETTESAPYNTSQDATPGAPASQQTPMASDVPWVFAGIIAAGTVSLAFVLTRRTRS